MLVINQERETLVLLLHEIYGINEHMKAVADEFAAQGCAVMVPDLLGKENPFSYEEEVKAYKHFNEEIGFEAAFKEVKILLAEQKSVYKEIWIIGYSAGATVAWLCSELPGVAGVIGFYGSRIRNYLEIKPACPVLLIYGDEEESFDVQVLVDRLASKAVQAVSLSGKHGFANPFTANYDALSNQEAKQQMKKFCNSIL